MCVLRGLGKSLQNASKEDYFFVDEKFFALYDFLLKHVDKISSRIFVVKEWKSVYFGKEGALTEAYNWRIYSFLSESYRSIFEISSICLEYNYHVSYLSYVYSAADQKFTCKSNKKIGEWNSIVGYVLYFTFTYKRSDSVWKSNLRVPEIDYIFF